eukprot:gene623-865_t
MLISIVAAISMFSLFTYITPLLEDVTGLTPHGVTGALLAIGVGLTIGNLIGGRLADRNLLSTVIGAFICLVMVLGALALVVHMAMPTLVLLVMWGGIAFALVSPLQIWVVDAATDAPNLASTLNQGAFNLGNATGAWIGGMALSAGVHYAQLPLLAASVALVALAMTLSVFVNRGMLPTQISPEFVLALRRDSFAFTAFLGTLTALPPLSIDMGLPGLPAIEATFADAAGRGPLTLSLFMAGFAISPLICGPIADRFGRRATLLDGLLLFSIAAGACALAPSFTVLLAFMEIRHLINGGNVYRPSAGLTEAALQVCVALAMAIGLERLRVRMRSRTSPIAIATAKSAIHACETASQDEADEIALDAVQHVASGADWKEGMAAFREKRAPAFAIGKEA